MKSKALGYGFNQFLGIAEFCERVVKDERERVDINAKNMGDAMEQCFAQVYDSDPKAALDFATDLVNCWGNMANEIRKSFKFRTTDDVLVGNWGIPMEGLFRMPFEFTTLVVHLKDVDIVIFIEERIQPEHNEKVLKDNDGGFEDPDVAMNDAYSRLGMGPGSLFYSITIGQFSKDPANRTGTGIFPIEVHVPMDAPMGTEIPCMYAYPVPKSIDPQSLDKYANVALVMAERFLCVLNHRAVKQATEKGLRPGVAHAPKTRKHKYRHFEHTTVVIDPNYLPAEGDSQPSGRHHRLHPVRGFWRHYKDGKTVWVKAHWRGDKDLGVIHHDYEVKT